MKIELTPCPFCGGPASDKTNGHSGWIGCMSCGIGDTYAPDFGGHNERAAWNNRVAQPSPKEAGDLVQPHCGCPFEEFQHRGITASIHADPGEPILAYLYDHDRSRSLAANTMEVARIETIAWIDGILDALPEPPEPG